ncbi:MAG: hypothetical protein M1827_001009 [Pycnora praestabilis]|nr:MAG: hypothetical protein M1827_001009 [Pycnora praestabilis]
MYHSGIGGGGFMLVRASDGSYEDIDFRETAPATAFQDMYHHNVNGSIYGGLASGIPSEIRGLEYLHKRYGQLPWAQTMRPAIDIARNGFSVTPDLVRYMTAASTKSNFLVADPTWAIDFAPNGTLLGLGDTITRKRYADTLEKIANHGPDVFYTGEMAEATIAAVQATNGTMTLEDLENYQVAIRDPIAIEYRGFKLTACGAPSGGTVALSVMNTIEGYSDFGDDKMLNLSTHRLDEAMRFAYGQRTNIGDPSYLDDMDAYQQQMLNNTTAENIRKMISDSHTLDISAYDPEGYESLATAGTSHVSTADANGMAITLTTTINLLFGNKLMVPETGVIMNNEMNDFSIPNVTNAFGYIPAPANFIRPGKRPLSSIAPVIAEHLDNSTLYFITGAAGGSRIITSTIQSLWHVLDRNMAPTQALSQPRLHDQLIPNQVTFEYAYDNATVAFMSERKHNVTWVSPGYSAVQAIRLLWNGTFEAAGEPRQAASAGYVV